jgi:hypothetical protein
MRSVDASACVCLVCFEVHARWGCSRLDLRRLNFVSYTVTYE